ncbi:MAG: diguanylate cyclase [Sphingomonas sp.]|uniref:diguanylate cyclase n=1 Tax=Sphingomonas sp. TaxID=28214 RepID=UPI001AD24AA0|nr:diguanylate cyclase [Sphingomonas sp.]MBN8807650.1 diguanylate cyclase [Sphingomonas sp.]
MLPTEPLPLHHSWPLDAPAGGMAQGMSFDPGRLPDASGRWQCDLASDTLIWDATVRALFGLPPGTAPTRDYALRCYAEDSRAAMERLRAHAIRHRRGFTLDVEIGPPACARQWVRLMAMPILDGGRVVALAGVKRRLDA